jgi:hypothetical protein
MTYYTHVYDIAVGDFPAACQNFTRLTGVEGIPQWEGYSGGHDGMHFPVGGLSTLGLLAPVAGSSDPTSQAIERLVARRGDGGFLLGFAVKNIDRTIEDLAARHVRHTDPWRVGDEVIIMTKPICGVAAVFAEHDDGHWEEWFRGRLRDKSVTPPPVTTRHRVLGTLGIEYATNDLGRSVDAFSALLGETPHPAPGPNGGSVSCYEFPLIGAQKLRVYGLGGGFSDAREQRIARVVEKFGDQLMSICFEVESAADSQRELEGLGFIFEAPSPVEEAGTITCATLPVHGVAFEYVQLGG